MMLDLMSGGQNRCHQFRMPGGPASDQEESRARVVLGEQFEQAWCVGRIRSIVDRQPNLAARGGKTVMTWPRPCADGTKRW